VIKVWIEEAAREGGPVLWRGRIQHVPGGRQRYFQELHEVAKFMAPYLRAMGAQLDDFLSPPSGEAID